MDCSNCGKVFQCKGNEACWCSAYPALLPVEETEGCLCPNCLRAQILLRIEALVQEVKAGGRENDLAQYGASQLLEGIDYYIESGLWVFTEWFHLKRGYCCGNGCRHCPYK